ncbi:MAG: hypothetical protein C4583_16065 [Anaerolineaceae bacterium]|nr:MAG: hypothetical protein C4583_16065 [Anaerolineaceae bacterium]
MQFIKDFVRNLVILVVIGMVLFFMFPGMMKQVFELYGILFGPLALVVLIVIALPRAKRKSR